MAFSWPFKFGNGEMDVAEAMGIVVTGLVVVFLVLVLLVVIFAIMGSFFTPKKTKEEKKQEIPEAKKEVKNVSAPKADHSIIAAITAALHEYLGGGGFVIKKIRPLKVGAKKTNAWGRSGKTENTRPF